MVKSLLRVGGLMALALATSLPVGVMPAAAQGIEIGPDGVRVLPDGRRGPPPEFRDGPPPGWRDRDRDRRGLSDREAVRIARSEGLRDVDDVSRRGRVIRVDGGDRRGRDITVIIDARSGDVIDVR